MTYTFGTKDSEDVEVNHSGYYLYKRKDYIGNLTPMSENTDQVITLSFKVKGTIGSRYHIQNLL